MLYFSRTLLRFLGNLLEKQRSTMMKFEVSRRESINDKLKRTKLEFSVFFFFFLKDV